MYAGRDEVRARGACYADTGLLRALVLLASDQTLPKGWPFVHQLLTESMEASCCYAVLSQKVESLPEAEALVDETSDWFAESPVFRQWERFVDVCGKIQPKHNIFNLFVSVVHASTGARHLPKNKVGIWNMLSTSLRFNKNDSVFITVEYTAAQDHAGPVALAVLPFADIASPQTDADEQVDGSVGHELILAFSCSTQVHDELLRLAMLQFPASDRSFDCYHAVELVNLAKLDVLTPQILDSSSQLACSTSRPGEYSWGFNKRISTGKVRKLGVVEVERNLLDVIQSKGSFSLSVFLSFSSSYPRIKLRPRTMQ
ncbi:hypothetical protein B0H16DRAFT_1465472 [Mycena metata]|uniref:Uncharacterized protein n=1 Tax=Mycena metata TaxID=1033252 RepID=A0AAD7MZG9_9AGAR|nr:hypothetical protein B0H16DRAFT_1465472 [Mycena metata]